MNPEEFGDKLGIVIDDAMANEGRISKARIRELVNIPDMNEDQWNLIYHYLDMEGIKVEGLVKDATAAGKLLGPKDLTMDTEDEQKEPEEKYIPEDEFDNSHSKGASLRDMYLEELESIPILTPTEEDSLVEAMLAGESDALRKLTESKLPMALDIAQGYVGRGIPELDLIQEANIILMMSLSEYSSGDMTEYLAERIRAGLDALVVDEFDFEGMSSRLAEQANSAIEASNELADELGRTASVEELAEYLHMDVSRVKEIMKMALDATNAMEQGKFGVDPSLFTDEDAE